MKAKLFAVLFNYRLKMDQNVTEPVNDQGGQESGESLAKDNSGFTTIEMALIVIAVIVIACVFISWAFGQVNARIAAGESAMSQVSRLENSMLENEFTMYDATEVPGSQLINIIKRYEQDNQKISIIVNNGRSETTYVYESDLSTKATAKAKDAKDKSSLDLYINPSSTYIGEVLRDGDETEGGTGAVIGIKFTKQ